MRLGAIQFISVWAVVLATGPCNSWGKVLYVDDDAAWGGDGSSWRTAYKLLQDALTAAEATGTPVEIRVAQGVYRPDRYSTHPNWAGSTFESFALRSGMSLKGGYAGVGAPDPNAKNMDLFAAVLSGDLLGNDGPLVLSAGAFGRADRRDNSRVILRADGVDMATVDGFIITGCSGSTAAGLFCASSSVTVTNCRFSFNSFRDSSAAIVVGGPGCLQARNCRFTNNVDDGSGSVLDARLGCTVSMEDCLFADNLAAVGSCLFCADGSLSLRNCLFHGCGSVLRSFHCVLTMVNCTLADNSPVNGIVVEAKDSSVLEARNSILWDAGQEIVADSTCWAAISYCDIRSGRGAIAISGERLDWGKGNLDTDPIFVSPQTGDFHLYAGGLYIDNNTWVRGAMASPCIDAGHPLDPVACEPSPNGGRINMGAYGGTPQASPTYPERSGGT